jgi:2-haloacid dehalogenase
VPKEEIREYARHIRKPDWSYLNLPDSWLSLRRHDEVPYAMCMLKNENTRLLACSNAPVDFMTQLSNNQTLLFDYIIPLELKKVYKPNPEAYKTILELFPVKPEEVLFVTANRDFGDLEGAAGVGMVPCLLERTDKAKEHFEGIVAKDLMDLANMLIKTEQILNDVKRMFE